MKNEPALDDIREIVTLPLEVGDFIDVYGDPMIGLAPGLHTLAITNIRTETTYDGAVLFDCATKDGEKDNIQIFPSEIIDWRKNP